MAATGEGVARARWGLEALLDRVPVGRALVTGVAGGLTPDLGVGTVVVAREVKNGTGSVPPPEASWRDAVLKRTDAVEVTVISSPRIALDPTAKAAVRRQADAAGSSVVDLESASLARVASEHGLPYIVIRAVSDAADETLPLDFERFRSDDGRIDQSRVLRHSLSRPALWLPLYRLRVRVRRCAEGLADVLEEALRP